MLHFLSSRLSIPQRVLLVAACAGPPVAVLLVLFVRQAQREHRFTAQELKGAAYIAEVWPSAVPGGHATLPGGAARAAQFGAESQAQAFVSAPVDVRAGRAAELIHAVADGSNLTLDTDLGSFYAMHAATVALPQLLAAVAPPQPIPDRLALGEAQALQEAASRDLQETIRRDSSGVARVALDGQPERIRAAFQGYLHNPASPALRGQLVSVVDQAWRADQRELTRLLQRRQARTTNGFVASLLLIILTLGAAVALAVGMTGYMGEQLKALLHALDRLNAGDAAVRIPYLQDPTETGRLAAALDGFRRGMIEAEQERLKAEAAAAAVRESEARYRMLAENGHDVIVQFDANFRVVYVSPSVRRYGYEPKQLVDAPSLMMVHPDDREAVADQRAAAQRGEAVKLFTGRIQAADGSWVWMERTMAALRNEDGVISGFVSTFRDIRERMAAEQALRQSEALYRMLADNTSDIIQRFNVEGVVDYVSPSVRQTGYEPEFFIGRPPAMLTDSADREAVLKRRDELLSGRPVPAHESRARCADGRMIWLESRPSPIHDEEGTFVGVVNVMRDVTARKAAEAAMQELNLELRRVARTSALGAFAASLAHEVNQPLAAAAISGEAALRWMSSDPPNHERSLQAMRRAVDDIRRAADVVGRMRAMVTKAGPARIDFDANDAIREVLALTERERERLGVDTRTELGRGTALLHGDRVQFQQVMINLVLNAIEAMHRTPEDERLLLIGSRPEAGWLEFRVEDRGPGVDADKQSDIFESLFTTKVGGTGLGLAISKSIVESHGGSIAVEAATPRGAVFRVRLPTSGDEA